MLNYDTASSILRCPVCAEVLLPVDSSVVCINNHHFDRARQGYINLLQGHKKRSCNPGDDQFMISSRTYFLNAGYYTAIADNIVSVIASMPLTQEQSIIIDAGCGEGYYTSRVRQGFPNSHMVGFDISKPAVQACCRRSKDIEWLVASVNDIPIISSKADIIISVFSRCDWNEFQRILKPGGYVLLLTSGKMHLQELREHIYEYVRPYSENKMLRDLPANFSLQSTHSIKGIMHLSDSASIMALLSMTPHYWRISQEQKKQLQGLDHLICHYDILLRCIKVL